MLKAKSLRKALLFVSMANALCRSLDYQPCKRSRIGAVKPAIGVPHPAMPIMMSAPAVIVMSEK